MLSLDGRPTAFKFILNDLQFVVQNPKTLCREE